MKLNYGSFEAIFRKYFSYNENLDYLDEQLTDFTEVDRTTLVLLASVRGDDHELEDVFSANSTTLSKFRTSERDINEKLKDLARTCPENYTSEYFEDNLMEYIPDHLYPALIQDFLKLIDYDYTIPVKTKNGFHQQIHQGLTEHNVSCFLASVLRYALLQDNTWHENAVINAPHGRNPFFTGRKEELYKIRNCLKNSNTVTISGMPGCGKSELSLAYVHSLPDEQWTVLFVNADTEAGIQESYRALLNFLSISDIDQYHDSEMLISQVRRWAKSGKCIFIFDNADFSDKARRKILQRYLPDLDQSTKIIFTTRNQQPFTNEEVIVLSELSQEDSVKYIMKRSNRTRNKKGAAALAQRLYCFPLALSQAASFLNIYQGISFESYLKKLDQGLGILEKYTDYSEAERSVRETMMITLESMTQAERDLMYLAAYFNEDGMHLDILNRLFYQMYRYREKDAKPYLSVIEDDTELKYTIAARLASFNGFLNYYYGNFTDEMAEKADVSVYSHYSMGGSRKADIPEFLQNEAILSLINEEDFLKTFYDITQKSMADFILSERNYDDLAYFNNIKSIKLHRLVMEVLREMDSDLHYLKLAINIMYDVIPNRKHGVVNLYEDYEILEPEARAICLSAFAHFNELPEECRHKVADISKYAEYWQDFDEIPDLACYGDPDFTDYACSDEECDREHMKAIRDLKLEETVPTTRWY